MWRIGGIARHPGFKVRFPVLGVRVGIPYALLPYMRQCWNGIQASLRN